MAYLCSNKYLNMAESQCHSFFHEFDVVAEVVSGFSPSWRAEALAVVERRQLRLPPRQLFAAMIPDQRREWRRPSEFVNIPL